MSHLADCVLQEGEPWSAGLYEQSWADYRATAALNPSTIVHGFQSMLHLHHAWYAPHKDTPNMQWGRAVHTLLLEPRTFEDRYRCWSGRRAGNEYKAFKEAADEVGAEVLKDEGEFCMDWVEQAAQQVLRNPRVLELVESGQAERAVTAVDHGMKCRGRIDWISGSQGRLVDVKTTRSLRTFSLDFFRLHYDVKLGLYQHWLNQATNAFWPVEVIVIENHPPFDAICIPVPDAVLDRGAVRGLRVIEQVRQCIEADCWPGAGGEEGVGTLDVPSWCMDDDDELEGAEEVLYEE